MFIADRIELGVYSDLCYTASECTLTCAASRIPLQDNAQKVVNAGLLDSWLAVDYSEQQLGKQKKECVKKIPNSSMQL